MKMVHLTVFLALILIVSAHQTDISTDKNITISNLVRDLLLGTFDSTPMAPEDNLLRIMVFGDFGMVTNYFDIGTMAKIMNELSKEHHYEYMITVGDNFYPNGIPYIWFRFIPWLAMTQFKRSAIKDTLIYPTLGNHDCYGSVQNSIEYSSYDSQWTLNSDYYVLKEPLRDDSSKFFVNLMLNSCKLFCATDEFPSVINECAAMHVTPGSDSVKAHYQWIEDQLIKYSNDPNVVWLAVTLHHPTFLQMCEKKYLLPMLRYYKVDAIFTGHEHWVEYANMDPSYQIRFPHDERGPILDDCQDKTELIFTDTRHLIYQKGEKLHQFTVGAGGADLINVCPFEDQDGEVLWRSTDGFGLMTAEMTTQEFIATYYLNNTDEVFKVTIQN